MTLGDSARKRLNFLTPLALAAAAAISIAIAPLAAAAQEAAPAAPAAVAPAAPIAAPAAIAPATAAPVVAPADGAAAPLADTYTPFGPDMIKGEPASGAFGFQAQHSPDGEYALWMHDAILMPLIVGISLLVLGLLFFVVVRFNKRSNPQASKTSHNTLIEVIWTLVPVLILVVVAVPSITLLARQYKSPAEDALTVKVTGYQWYWGYTYPDNGGFEVISTMLSDADALDAGMPLKLATDNRMVVPVGEELRIQVIGADVIHSFAVPSLWFKIDAVPGRINERTMTIKDEGIYFGQCSELCGARHAYMPIMVEAVSRPKFNAWVRANGGTLPGDEVAEPASDTAAPAAAAPAVVPAEPAPAAAEAAPAT